MLDVEFMWLQMYQVEFALLRTGMNEWCYSLCCTCEKVWIEKERINCAVLCCTFEKVWIENEWMNGWIELGCLDEWMNSTG